MVKITCLLIGSFLVLQINGTIKRPGVPVCGVNRVFSRCSGHCDKTCSVRNPICPRICKPGCICKPGYMRDDIGRCIKEGACPPLCGRHEVYSPCGGQCQKTCKNQNPICSLICRPGCICRPNYVRDIRTNKCIKKNQCPPLCGINEVSSSCIVHCRSGAGNKHPKCTTVCRPGCICRPNYVRDWKTKKCVKKNRCQKPKSGINEVFACHVTCPLKTCRSMLQRKICPALNPYRKRKYLRNSYVICIPYKQCYPISNVQIDESNTDNGPPADTIETLEPNNDDVLPPADDDIDDDEDEYDD